MLPDIFDRLIDDLIIVPLLRILYITVQSIELQKQFLQHHAALCILQNRKRIFRAINLLFAIMIVLQLFIQDIYKINRQKLSCGSPTPPCVNSLNLLWRNGAMTSIFLFLRFW